MPEDIHVGTCLIGGTPEYSYTPIGVIKKMSNTVITIEWTFPALRDGIRVAGSCVVREQAYKVKAVLDAVKKGWWRVIEPDFL